MNASEPTPLMKQYLQIRAGLSPEIVLLFRVGDFYEMFYDDAVRAAPVLGVALTARAGAPLCGIPYHALENYLSKFIRAGVKAAICDQVEDPKLAKGIVRREITRIVTPGTVTEDGILDSSSNNFIGAVSADGSSYGFALMDLSTGEFFTEGHETMEALVDSITRMAPAEMVVGRGQPQVLSDAIRPVCRTITPVDDWTFQPDAARQELLIHFKVSSLEGFGCEYSPLQVSAAGALLHYVGKDLLRNVSHVRGIKVRTSGDNLALDETTCRNLDLVPSGGKPMDMTLLGVLGKAATPMGARNLKSWLLRPSGRLDDVNARLDAVEWFTRHRQQLSSFREGLAAVRDLERLIARIGSGLGNGRDLRSLATSLQAVPNLRATVAAPDLPALMAAQVVRLDDLPDLVSALLNAITDSPPISVREGDIIRHGYNKDLDELRSLAGGGHEWLASFQASEQERTGIKTLKVRHNKIFGFYIEVSKGQLENVPDNYERRQTLVGAERFVTPELKEKEALIFGAQEKSQALEYELFCGLRDMAAAETAKIQETGSAIAVLDTLAAFATCALENDYVRPQMHDGDELVVESGRHPVIERMDDAERFVPNSTRLDCASNQIAIITGPNMAGKSTYIRQVAVICIMAHAGSFVPAASARIPMIDRVFSRVGAGDDLARGRSTFMVEMQEAANILNNATPRSLVILDEIGRGTSTFDGISIAWSVAEYLHNNPKVKAKTLFATHYHELTDLALDLPGVKNYSVQVRERGDSIVFLRTIAPGPADKSYGIHVARLAGMPDQVIARAGEILKNLEADALDAAFKPKIARSSRKNRDDPNQLTLF